MDGGGHRPIIVVGAGPVGLAAALALRARDLPVTVLEAEPEDRVRPGSRAIYIHGSSLRLLDRVRPGLGRTLADHGLVWHTKRTLWRGREVFRRSYAPGDGDRLPPFTSLPQVDTERHLLDACRDAGVEVVWSAPVADVATSPDGVSLTTDGGGAWTADYVVGADGARSAVRAGIDASMEGSRSANWFIVVDVAEDPDEPRSLERIFHYEHPAVDGRDVLLVPFAGGWRVDLQLREGDDHDELSSEPAVRRWITAVLDAGYAERLTWVSSYRFLQVVARTFTDPHRRVLLAGEAAHLFAPFGARGMNSGFADALAAADAIDAALERGERGAIGDAARRRHDAAEFNRNAAGQALAHMKGDGLVLRLKRRVAVALAPVVEEAGAWLDRAPYGPRTAPPTASGTRY